MRKPKLKVQLYRAYFFRWIPFWRHNRLDWKDKFGTPRCSRPPQFTIEWLWFGIYGSWEDDKYWEQWLWTYKYNKGDIKKAKETWEWTDYKTGKSTWKEY